MPTRWAIKNLTSKRYNSVCMGTTQLNKPFGFEIKLVVKNKKNMQTDPSKAVTTIT